MKNYIITLEGILVADDGNSVVAEMSRRIVISLIILALIVIVQQPPVFSQVSCGVVNLRFQHTDAAHPNELIHTVSIVTASCFFYSTVIVDLVDSRTSKILSRVIWPYAPLANPVSPPLINQAFAPNQLGYWALTLLVNFAGSTSGVQFTILIET